LVEILVSGTRVPSKQRNGRTGTLVKIDANFSLCFQRRLQSLDSDGVSDSGIGAGICRGDITDSAIINFLLGYKTIVGELTQVGLVDLVFESVDDCLVNVGESVGVQVFVQIKEH